MTGAPTSAWGLVGPIGVALGAVLMLVGVVVMLRGRARRTDALPPSFPWVVVLFAVTVLLGPVVRWAGVDPLAVEVVLAIAQGVTGAAVLVVALRHRRRIRADRGH